MLLAPPLVHLFLFLSLVKELSGLFGDVLSFTAEARGREKETSLIHPFTKLRLSITCWTCVRVCVNTCLYFLWVLGFFFWFGFSFAHLSCAWHTQGSLMLA